MKIIQQDHNDGLKNDLAFEIENITKQAFVNSHHWTSDQIVQSLQTNHYLFAKEKDSLIGYLCYSRFADEAELLNLAVQPAWQKQKVALQLLQQACKLVFAAGAQSFFLEVRPSNERALRLYYRMGFVELYRRRNYYSQPTEDAIVMKLDLLKETSKIHENL